MDLILEHPELPKAPICAQIVRMVPGLTEISEDDLGLGISFLATFPSYYDQIDAYVASHLPERFPQAHAGRTMERVDWIA